MRPPFKNEPVLDFSRPEDARALAEAIRRLESTPGREYPLVIGGKRIDTRERIVSVNPARKDQVVARVAKADRTHAEQAIEAAWKAFAEWSRVPPAERARVLFRAAAILRRRRHDINAWNVLEIAKEWDESDGETAETIDFLEYYGREMLRYSQGPALASIAGEDNDLQYIPLGVGVIIPPWNFPVAISVGMAIAAIVAGNAVILKPSSLTPGVVAELVSIFEEAGLPPGVLNYVPGPSAEIGDYLVSHPLTRFIAFTGSRDVGLHINELAAKRQPGQRWIKRFVGEMGGKDAIVVDESADLEDAAKAVVISAFSFQGQKCSAASRVIVHESVHKPFVEQVVERAATLRVGQARDRETNVSAVADENQHRKILGYLEIGRKEGRLMLGGDGGPDMGYYIQPTIFADVAPTARLSREEIFGPVVAFTKAKDFEQAIEFANATEYGLTGAVFTTDRQKLIHARRSFHVGNLYLNRKCTGAFVGVHPFGGFNMSGTDSKAGGPDYLLHFLQGKSITERFF